MSITFFGRVQIRSINVGYNNPKVTNCTLHTLQTHILFFLSYSCDILEEHFNNLELSIIHYQVTKFKISYGFSKAHIIDSLVDHIYEKLFGHKSQLKFCNRHIIHKITAINSHKKRIKKALKVNTPSDSDVDSSAFEDSDCDQPSDVSG